MLYSSLYGVFRNRIPNELITSRSNDKSWFKSNIKNAISKRDRYHRKFKITGNQYYYDSFKTQQNRVSQLIRDTKTLYENNILKTLDSCSNAKKNYCVIIKKLLGNTLFSTEIPPMVDPIRNRLHESDLEKATLFLKTVSNKFHKNHVPNRLPAFPDRCRSTVTLHHTTPATILKLINNLHIGKAYGPDSITNKMLKMSAPSISDLLCTLFNKLMDKEIFPDSWKIGTVTVIYK